MSQQERRKWLAAEKFRIVVLGLEPGAEFGDAPKPLVRGDFESSLFWRRLGDRRR